MSYELIVDPSINFNEIFDDGAPADLILPDDILEETDKFVDASTQTDLGMNEIVVLSSVPYRAPVTKPSGKKPRRVFSPPTGRIPLANRECKTNKNGANKTTNNIWIPKDAEEVVDYKDKGFVVCKCKKGMMDLERYCAIGVLVDTIDDENPVFLKVTIEDRAFRIYPSFVSSKCKKKYIYFKGFGKVNVDEIIAETRAMLEA